MLNKYHVAFGVYGIIGDRQSLVVIKKNDGPYKNRFDLPGGSLEDGEPLAHAIVREIEEETALRPVGLTQLGTTSFRYPWTFRSWRLNQHICVFYRIDTVVGSIAPAVKQFPGQDSLGAVRMQLASLNLRNSSPLVVKAKEYLANGGDFDVKDTDYSQWEVLDQPVFDGGTPRMTD